MKNGFVIADKKIACEVEDLMFGYVECTASSLSEREKEGEAAE